MEALLRSDDIVSLRFRRLGRVGCVDFPNGARAYGPPGEPLIAMAKRAGFQDIEIGCNQGTCGTCEFVLRLGQDDSDRVRPVRMCKSRLPKADPTAGAMELLSTESEAAQRYYERLRNRPI